MAELQMKQLKVILYIKVFVSVLLGFGAEKKKWKERVGRQKKSDNKIIVKSVWPDSASTLEYPGNTERWYLTDVTTIFPLKRRTTHNPFTRGHKEL